ncbi:MAG: MaoC family dehydratase [Myxococcales bacterium]|jgi:acyl dehydratase|nr:MaoC family dehydratase [Myxococcales bacterium]
MSQCLYLPASELPQLIGKTLGPSDWKDVTQEVIDQFGQATGDQQWIHVDPVRAAKESPFRRKTVAHGYFTLALIPGFFFSLLEVEGCRLIVNLDASDVRWPAPVRIPSRVRLHAFVQDVTAFESGMDLHLQMTIEIEGQARPALEAKTTYRYYVRSAPQTEATPSASTPDQ